jgi:hypothetical protein
VLTVVITTSKKESSDLDIGLFKFKGQNLGGNIQTTDKMLTDGLELPLALLFIPGWYA